MAGTNDLTLVTLIDHSSLNSQKWEKIREYFMKLLSLYKSNEFTRYSILNMNNVELLLKDGVSAAIAEHVLRKLSPPSDKVDVQNFLNILKRQVFAVSNGLRGNSSKRIVFLIYYGILKAMNPPDLQFLQTLSVKPVFVVVGGEISREELMSRYNFAEFILLSKVNDLPKTITAIDDILRRLNGTVILFVFNSV